MRAWLRVGLITGLLAGVCWTPIAARATVAEAQTVDPVLKTRVDRRFRVLQLHDGVVLTPRREVRGLQSIEIRNGLIAIDGSPATGAQLRERLGADADLVLQVSYLPAETLAAWSGVAAPAKVPDEDAAGPASRDKANDADAEPDVPAPPPPPAPPEPDTHEWRRKSSAKVHIGSSILVAEDELVTEPVVAVGGSVTVLGRVDDSVVAVGGSVHLGPKAHVRGDVTAVGGRIEQEKGASIDGSVNEVRFFGPQFHLQPWHMFAPFGGELFGSWFRLLGTVLRISIVMLLTLLVMLIAARPVERIGDRAGREPWLSGFTGLLAQLLFVPVLVITVVVLAISIIGIPLLLLVPFAVIGFLIAILVGFTGVAHRVGRWAVGPHRPGLVALAVGVVLVSGIALISRGVSLLPVPLWPLTWVVGGLGFLAEYVVWTVGLGAALLTRFGTRGGSHPYAPASELPPPLPPVTGPTEA
jgi:hypothetical protein